MHTRTLVSGSRVSDSGGIVGIASEIVRSLVIEETIALGLGVLFGIIHAATTPEWVWTRAGLDKGRWVMLQVVAVIVGLGLVGFIAYAIRVRPRLKEARTSYADDRDAAMRSNGRRSRQQLPNHVAAPDEPTISGLDVASIRRALDRK